MSEAEDLEERVRELLGEGHSSGEPKAGYEGRLKGVEEPPVKRAKVDHTLPSEEIQEALYKIQRAAGDAMYYLATRQTDRMRARLREIEGLLEEVFGRKSPERSSTQEAEAWDELDPFAEGGHS